jgi:hypothetical protein
MNIIVGGGATETAETIKLGIFITAASRHCSKLNWWSTTNISEVLWHINSFEAPTNGLWVLIGLSECVEHR